MVESALIPSFFAKIVSQFMKYLLICCLLIFTIACNNDAPQNKTNSENPAETIESTYSFTELPSDTSELWIADGAKDSDTTIIFAQGGPRDFLNFKPGEKTSWRYLPRYDHYRKVFLHQANTYNPSMFEYEGKFTMEIAEKEIDLTSEMMYRAIKYYKDRGKTVIVIGHSYGAFIIPHCLSTRPSLADKYCILSGRIDVNENAYKAHLQGVNGSFEKDNRFVIDVKEELTARSPAERRRYRIKQRLKGVLGKPRYSEELQDRDLSKVIYIHSTNDTRVGVLEPAEIAFLESKGAQVFDTEYEHEDTFYALVDLITEETIPW